MPPQPKIVFISSSFEAESRSRPLARCAERHLAGLGVRTDFIDLCQEPPTPYPAPPGHPSLESLKERFNAADGWVLASPVHNWSVSSALTAFLNHALDSDQRRYRPFVLLAGAGSDRSHLAFDGVGRMMIYEISAVQVGPAIVASGEMVNKKTGVPDSKLDARIRTAMVALVAFTKASIDHAASVRKEG